MSLLWTKNSNSLVIPLDSQNNLRLGDNHQYVNPTVDIQVLSYTHHDNYLKFYASYIFFPLKKEEMWVTEASLSSSRQRPHCILCHILNYCSMYGEWILTTYKISQFLVYSSWRNFQNASSFWQWKHVPKKEVNWEIRRINCQLSS